ncbi:MAG: glycerophosphodiester phosphodiesterase family protein [Campylobacterales bacterium]|nr:glycerophosphodiester phosphodiesterase family protein [Campylobacterales bacterium]
MKILELLNRKGLIGAHRGARALRPENTLSALQMAVGCSDFIEVDVQFSSDKVAVIMHDETLARTTNINEIENFKSRAPYRVYDFSYKELCTLDYGNWFYKNDPFHQIAEDKVNIDAIRDKREPLLTLHETLQFVKKNNLFINVEIKDVHVSLGDEEVVNIVANEIESLQVQEHVLLTSFRHEYLPLCKAKLPNVATAALVAKKHPKTDINELIDYLKSLQADGYHLNDGLVEKELVSKLHAAGFFVNVYTVNNPLRQKTLFAMGVNGIFSDFCK